MAGVKRLSLIQISIDTLFVSVVLLSYFSRVFEYMSNYSMGIITIQIELTDRETDLQAFVSAGPLLVRYRSVSRRWP